MEELDYLTSFEAISRKNAEEKIRMLKKIKNNYNSKTIGRENLGYSIESVCMEQIQSLEDAVRLQNLRLPRQSRMGVQQEHHGPPEVG